MAADDAVAVVVAAIAAVVVAATFVVAPALPPQHHKRVAVRDVMLVWLPSHPLNHPQISQMFHSTKERKKNNIC